MKIILSLTDTQMADLTNREKRARQDFNDAEHYVDHYYDEAPKYLARKKHRSLRLTEKLKTAQQRRAVEQPADPNSKGGKITEERQ